MSYEPPYKISSNNVKVELDFANYATKTDLKNITHVDVSSFASKTNLAALKTEVDKIDTDKLKAAPIDLAKLTNAIQNDVVKKTDYNTKVTSIEAQIAGLTKNTVDNLADITKLKAIDTNSFVNKTKFSADINTLDDKIDGVEKNNNSATDIKLSKAQIKKLLQSGGFLGNLLSKLAGPLMKVALPLARNVLAPLGLTAAMSAIDGSIQKKIYGSGATKGAGVKLIIEQEDMNDIMKIIKTLENFGILLKGVSKAIKNETKEQKGGFLSMLLGMLTVGKGIMHAGDGIVRAGDGSKKKTKFTVTFSSFNKYRNK